MIPYEWQCHACKASNEACEDKCAACGCSANATIKEINKFAPPEPPSDTPLIDAWLLLALVVVHIGIYFLFDYSQLLAALFFPVIFVVTAMLIFRGWKRFFGIKN